MTQKTFHTIAKAECLEHVNLFHPRTGFHYIDLPNGRILVVTTFVNEAAEETFHLRTTTRKSLPHPVFQGKEVIHPDHAQELQHLFTEHDDLAKRREAAATATVIDIARHAAQLHPLMNLSTFAYRSWQGKKT